MIMKPIIQKQKVQKVMTEIGGGWYMEKITKILTPLRRPKLSEKSKGKYDKKKLYETNRYWNDQKLQLHLNKLEWVNPRSQIKRKNTIQFLQFYT